MTISEHEYKVIKCICCWYDLLGFGKPFIDAKWDLENPLATTSIQRIFSEASYFSGQFSLMYGRKLHLNDGIVSTFDYDSTEETYIHNILIFLEAILTDFESLNIVDKRNQHPGVRGIITNGCRVSYDSTNTSYLVNTKEDISYHPREFQMNTAFSKAFIVEESGTAAGISGPYMYIDQSIIDIINAPPYHVARNSEGDKIRFTITRDNDWLASLFFDSEYIQYNKSGIHTVFYRFLSKETIIDYQAKEIAFNQARHYAHFE